MRIDIVNEARTWLGTKFKHQGRVKGVGCDCIGLIVALVRDLNILDKEGKELCKYDNTSYGREPDGEFLKKSLDSYLIPISDGDIKSGDVLLFRFDKEPQHVAIVTDYHGGGLGIIHCYAASRKVVEHKLDDLWKDRIVSSYSFLKHYN